MPRRIRIRRSVAAENKDVLLVRFAGSPCQVDDLRMLVEAFVAEARRRDRKKRPCGCGEKK